MRYVLDNGVLELEFWQPGSQYTFSRFDWMGNITGLRFERTHQMLGNEKLDPLLFPTTGRGIVGEFGINCPVGYDDCPVGGYFPKIGVGLLKKTDDTPYFFAKRYEVVPADWSMQLGEREITFSYVQPPVRGLAFTYQKHVRLEQNQVRVTITLENTGEKPIITNEYSHNFIAINRRHFGPAYVLGLPGAVSSSSLTSLFDPSDALRFIDSTISWRHEPQEYMISGLHPKEGAGQFRRWSLVSLEDGVGIEEEVDFEPSGLNIWGREFVIGPELFKSIDLKPSQSDTWSRNFRVFRFEK